MINKSRKEINNEIYGRVNPQIYAFYINRLKQNAYTKIGDTYRPVNIRLNEWKNIFGEDLTPLYQEDAVIDNEVYYRDISVHKFLKEKLKKETLRKEKSKQLGFEYYSKEFFKDIITPDDIDKARENIEKNYKKQNYNEYDYYKYVNENDKKEIVNYRPREDQKKVVKNFIKAVKAGKKKLLMHAVMRFGKSFTAMLCAKKMKANFVLIVSAKKDVISEWENTIKHHKMFQDYRFLTAEDLKNDIDNDIVCKLIKRKKKVVVCTTLEDLTPKKVKDRYKQLFHNKISLMIIDEAHYGLGGYKQSEIVNNVKNKEKEEKSTKKNDKKEKAENEDKELSGVDIDKVMSMIENKMLDVKVQLFLSGTPYTILAQKSFSDDEVICSIGYNDIIRSKKALENEIIKKENMNEWDNEYYGFPEMQKFGFNINDESVKKINGIKQFNCSYELNELFKIKAKTHGKKHPEFVHKQDVLNLLQAIDGSKKYGNILDFLNFDAIKNGKICRHIVMVFNQKSMCDAMEDLLKENSDKFINLKTKGKEKKYNIINISGNNNKKYNLENTKETISEYEKHDQKTISLTVKRMMTGVTVKEWDTMFMFKTTSSPEEYDQATFRLESAYIEKKNKISKNKNNAYIFNDKKPQTIFVDFDIKRMFEMQDNASRLNGYKTLDNLKQKSWGEKIQDNLNYLPITTMFKNEIKKVESVDIIKAITNYTKNKSILDEISDINYNELDVSENERILKLIIKQNELTTSKSKFEFEAFVGEKSEIDYKKLFKKVKNIRQKTTGAGKEEISKEEKNILDSLRNRKKMLIAKLLFFSYLSKDNIKKFSDILLYIEKGSDNKRIAKHLNLSKNDVALLLSTLSEVSISKIDQKIEKANLVSSDTDIEGIDKTIYALSEFNRFSDAEIVTPISICNNLYKNITKDILIDSIKKGYKILDISSKQGEFAYALHKLLKNDIDSKLLYNAIYSIPSSPIAYEFTKKMYETIGLNPDNIFYDIYSYELGAFNNKKELINFYKKEIVNKLVNKKGEKEMLHFDIVVGNPPYQEKGGSGGNNDAPIYQNFIYLANALNANVYSFIIKAAWLTTGRKQLMDPFRQFMMADKKISNMKIYTDASKVFGKDVDIKGGICIFLHNKRCVDKCKYELNDQKPIKRNLDELKEYNVIIRDAILSNIAKKVINHFNEKTITLNNIISNDTPFGISSNLKKNKTSFCKVHDDKKYEVEFFYMKSKDRKVGYISKNDIIKNKLDIDKYKVFVPESYGAGESFPHQIIGVPEMANRKSSACSQSYLYAAFNTKEEAENFYIYLHTKFLRALVAAIKLTQTATADVYKFVPALDFSKKSKIFYTNGCKNKIEKIDEILFSKYKFDSNEKKYIKSIIKDMKDTSEDIAGE